MREKRLKKENKMGAELEDVRSGKIREKSRKLRKQELHTSFRAFSSFGLLSSTLSLDCCLSFLSSAVTKGHRNKEENRDLEGHM